MVRIRCFTFLSLFTIAFVVSACFASGAFADDKPAVNEKPPATEKPGAKEPSKKEVAKAKPKFKLSKDVEEALLPFFRSIAKADVSRATVELSAETLDNGSVVDRKKSTYQIASKHPNLFTVYLKQPDQRTRLYCDGTDFFAAVAPDAYFKLPEPLSLFDAVFDMPVPLGPYPEAVFALTFAGADPSLTLLGGMESVEIVDRGKFRGTIPSIHFKGVQDDGVVWDFWISQEKQPKPLRLLVNLTDMLRDNAQMKMEPGVSYELRYDFLTWRMTGNVDNKLFKYVPPKDATEFESLDDYYAMIAEENSKHPLLGKKAPQFEAELLNGKVIGPKELKNKILVIDFWATWCSPCVEAMPVIEKVCRKFEDKDVVLMAINVGEETDLIKEFVKKQGWKINVVLDDQMEVSKGFTADVIPLTMLVSKAGIVESMHFGFPGTEALEQRLTDELEVLTVGGVIETASPEEKQKMADENKAKQPAKKPPAKTMPTEKAKAPEKKR